MEAKGHKVTVVNTAAEALETLKTTVPKGASVMNSGSTTLVRPIISISFNRFSANLDTTSTSRLNKTGTTYTPKSLLNPTWENKLKLEDKLSLLTTLYLLYLLLLKTEIW